MAPKISVCMPTYNYARYLPEAIESVLMQDHKDFELLILDDHSRDDSAAVIERYARQDSRIIARIHSENLGMVRNWNACLEMARGSYIKFLFGDDLLASPSALSRMAAVLDAEPGTSLVASARKIIDENSRPVRTAPALRSGRFRSGTDVIRNCLLEQRNRIGEPSAVLFRKAQARRGFDVRYRQIVDLEMWFHLLEQGSLSVLPEPLVAFRVHPEQQTQHNKANRELIDEPFLLIDRYGSKPYIRFPWHKREYMRYLPVYSVWKLYRQHGKIGRQEALAFIAAKYGLPSFVLGYPLFKLYKSYLRSTQPS